VITKKGRHFEGKNKGDALSCRPGDTTLMTPLFLSQSLAYSLFLSFVACTYVMCILINSQYSTLNTLSQTRKEIVFV